MQMERTVGIKEVHGSYMALYIKQGALYSASMLASVENCNGNLY
jgi:hypothetical protein